MAQMPGQFGAFSSSMLYQDGEEAEEEEEEEEEEEGEEEEGEEEEEEEDSSECDFLFDQASSHTSVGGKRPASFHESPSKRPNSGLEDAPVLSMPSGDGTDADKLAWAMQEIQRLSQAQVESNRIVTKLKDYITSLLCDTVKRDSFRNETKQLVDRISELEQRKDGSGNVAMDSQPLPPTQTWNSPAANQIRPTQSQLTTLASALQHAMCNTTKIEQVTRILCLTHGDYHAFLDGLRTLNLADPAVPSRTLWQLWAFAVHELPLKECLPDQTVVGYVAASFDYGSALFASTATPPLYFSLRSFNSMAPPRPVVRPLPITGLVALGARSSTPGFGSPATSTGTPGVCLPMANLGISSPAFQLQSSVSSSSIGSTSGRVPSTIVMRNLQAKRDAYVLRTNEFPTANMEQSAVEFFQALAPLKAKIARADAEEVHARNNNLSLPVRTPETQCPDWPPGLPEPLVEEGPKAPRTCGICGDPGILNPCHGCGESFHFSCCDKDKDEKRQPPESGAAWFCGRECCKGSAWATICGWKPKAANPETFKCPQCLEDLTTNMQCVLEGCVCKTERFCTGCVHELVFRRKAGEESINCGLCRQACTALVRSSGDTDQVKDMPRGGDDGDDDGGEYEESVANVVRRRRGSLILTAQEVSRREAVTASLVLQVDARVASGEITLLEGQSHRMAASGVDVDVFHEIVGEPDSDDEAYERARQDGLARSKAGGRETSIYLQRDTATTGSSSSSSNASPLEKHPSPGGDGRVNRAMMIPKPPTAAPAAAPAPVAPPAPAPAKGKGNGKGKVKGKGNGKGKEKKLSKSEKRKAFDSDSSDED